MNLIFLDIDGVANSVRSFLGLGPSYPPKHEDLPEEEGLDKLAVLLRATGTERPLHPTFDPVAVGLLRRLCEESGASVYVHSSWAEGRPAEYFRRLFRHHYGWEAPIVEHRAVHGERRADRIRDALATYAPERYVILDDQDLTDVFGEHAVVVNGEDGLSYADYSRACDLLGVKRSGVLI